MSSRSSVDRAPAQCSGGHGFDSCRGLRIFRCPTLVSCWLIHLHISLLSLKLAIFINLSQLYTINLLASQTFRSCARGNLKERKGLFFWHSNHHLNTLKDKLSHFIASTEHKHEGTFILDQEHQFIYFFNYYFFHWLSVLVISMFLCLIITIF